MLRIEQKHLDSAIRAGACEVKDSWVGMTWEELFGAEPEAAEWAAENLPYLAPEETEELYRLTGTKTWWRDGKRHREDGPAYEGADGTKAWYRDGKPQPQP